MPPNDTMSELLDRIERNSALFARNYGSANELLNVSIGEAVPWVLGLPVVRGRIPAAFRSAIPKGAPVTLDKLERLTTQLVAILAASYAQQENGDGPPRHSPAKIINLQGASR